MVQKFHAVYDGKVLLPREQLNIKPNTEVIIIISDENLVDVISKDVHPLEAISQLSTDMGPDDLSENFDKYTGRRLTA